MIAGWTMAEIATEIGIAQPTLRKHYFRQIERARRVCLREAKGRVLMQLDAAAEQGNVGAMKELRKVVEEAERTVTPRPLPDRKPEAKGKKELRQELAKQAPVGRWARPSDEEPLH